MGTRVVISGYIGLILYCCLSILWGPMGLRAYSDLDTRVGKMKENIESLENLHDQAQVRLKSAQSNPETLALEARSLGYVKKGEVVVHIGFPDGEPSTRDLGTLIPYTQPKGMGDTYLKTISIVAALISFFCGIALIPAPGHTARRGRAKRAGQEGTRPVAPGAQPTSI